VYFNFLWDISSAAGEINKRDGEILSEAKVLKSGYCCNKPIKVILNQGLVKS